MSKKIYEREEGGRGGIGKGVIESPAKQFWPISSCSSPNPSSLSLGPFSRSFRRLSTSSTHRWRVDTSWLTFSHLVPM